MSTPRIELIESNDPVAQPWRVALVRPDHRPAVRESDEKYVMTFPHLIVRELIMFQLVVIGLSLIAIFFDAPLESIANPVETPNPAKAPWYFLGLQELLHYFPPVVAGVLLPAMVVLCLVTIPYAKVNLDARPLWESGSKIKGVLVGGLLIAIVVLFSFFECWPVVIPTAILGAAIFWGRLRGTWFSRVTLPEWIMTWFVVIAGVLTVIGTFFRGPGWSWVWPWE
jgi:quinol-cytochrome oxidoreductase complex cytochrome b subunit